MKRDWENYNAHNMQRSLDDNLLNCPNWTEYNVQEHWNGLENVIIKFFLIWKDVKVKRIKNVYLCCVWLGLF